MTQKTTICKHQPHYAHGLCVKCYLKEYHQRLEVKERNRLKDRERYKDLEYRQKKNAKQREYLRTHPEQRAKNAENQRRWHKRNPDKYTEYYAKSSVKILVKTVDESGFISPEFTDAFVKGSHYLDDALEKVGTHFKQDFGSFFQKKEVEKHVKKETEKKLS